MHKNVPKKRVIACCPISISENDSLGIQSHAVYPELMHAGTQGLPRCEQCSWSKLPYGGVDAVNVCDHVHYVCLRASCEVVARP